MKDLLKKNIFLLLALCTFTACSTSDDPTGDEPSPEPPVPAEKVIETTEEGSSKLVMLGYEDNLTEGGVLQPEEFAVPVYIKDKKLCGTSYTFAGCSEVKRLDAMHDFSTMVDWKEQGIIAEGAFYWICYTTDTEYAYVKLRIAYVDGNKVGVEYKVASKQKRPDIDDIEITESGAKAFVMKGLSNGTDVADGLQPEGLSSKILVCDKCFTGENYSWAGFADVQKLSDLPEVTAVTNWERTIAVSKEMAYWVRYATSQENVYLKLRVAYIDGDNIGLEYAISLRETVVNGNANTVTEGRNYVTDYAIPHLNAENYYVEHVVSADNQTLLNYALEWNNYMKHAQWVAFSFDAITSVKNVKRSEDTWAVDPLLPADMRVDNKLHTNDGFDRGHLCASDDRAFSTDANKQTFYFSNITPQFNSFNGGYWLTFEQLLLSWVRKDKSFLGTYDKVYVAKGGTLDRLLLNYTGNKAGQDGVLPTTDENGFTPKGLPVPQYYYMAVLAHRAGQPASEASAYQAIGFLVEHRDDYGYTFEHPLKREDAQAYAVSIDKLEQETGIDFFCNLPDVIEDEVEKAYNKADWAW